MHQTPEVLLAARAAHEANRTYCLQLGDESQPSVGGSAGVAAPVCARWRARKLREGRRYGPEKSAAEKTHPCLVSYHELPEAQRIKDTLFGAAVRGVLSQHA